MKVLICVALLTFGAVVKAQNDYKDYWDGNYANYDDYNLSVDDSNEDTEVKQAEATQVDAVPTEAPTESDEFDDYQIEDNRSDAADKEAVEENTEVTAEATAAEEPASEPTIHKVLPLEVLPLEEPEQNNEDVDLKELGLDEDALHETADDDLVPLPVPELNDNDNDNIFEDTKDISNKGQDYLDELDQAPVEDDKNLDKIIEETNKLLAESDDAFDANDYDNPDEQVKSDEDAYSEYNDENAEDTPAKVYADLNADLDKLFETLDKLSDNNTSEEASTYEQVLENGDFDKLFETLDKMTDNKTSEQVSTDEQAVDDVKDYEEKFGRPYNEDVALSWRNAEGNNAAEPQQNDETADENDNKNAEDVVSDEEGADDDYENIFDSNLSQIFNENANASIENHDNNEQDLVKLDANNDETAKETTEAHLEKIDAEKEVIDYADNYDDSNDSEPNADDDIDSVIKQIFANDVKEPQAYGDDALVDDKYREEGAMELDELNTTVSDEEPTQKTAMIDDLNSAELSELVTQFVAAHKEEFDVNSESFAKHVAPVHITLSVDEPEPVTSPEFPDNYPAGNTIDWVFTGPGMGIELNITDFDVNGANGDYLLVIPGGLDDSSKDGLVFTHHLNSVKRYRFTDVNRMFVRFYANENLSPNKQGFRFYVKLIEPLPVYEEEPEAEPVANPPAETLTLNLAGLTLPRFQEIREQFRELLADMAKEYIRDNKITLGLNTTYEVTQITRTAVCNIQWPEYENCVELTFGVPLHYEEEPEEPRLNAEELDNLWTTYINKEEFSERLRSLGITEYAIPNDRTVLMVWLVIAAGVLISMAMLAFALWRFSCFEDYTRMPQYGDTDSIQNEKRHLDLYPTPHQTLPPLYSENDYKWADDKYDDSTRVDMGGFANRSYNRDELYDLDSDEDIIPPRDRKGAFSPTDYSDA